MLIVSAGAFYWYGHRSRPRKDWPPISLKSKGIRASFHTELRSGSVLYGFTVEPLSPEFAEDFQRKAASASTKGFTVILRDVGSLHLCSEEVGTLVAAQDDSGNTKALIGEGHLACSASDYLAAASWDLRYDFPKLEFEPSSEAKLAEQRLLADPQFLSLPAVKQRETLEKVTGDQDFASLSDSETAEFIRRMRTPKKRAEPKAFEERDNFSSFDPDTNLLETSSGSEFYIPDVFARSTASEWSRGAGPAGSYTTPLDLSCDSGGSCTIENRWNGQTIKAKLRKHTTPTN